MKLAIKTLILATSLSLIPAFASAQLITVDVIGMTCAGCASMVKTSLEQLPEVARADIDVARGNAALTLKDINAEPQEAELRRAVEKAGYSAGAVHY